MAERQPDHTDAGIAGLASLAGHQADDHRQLGFLHEVVDDTIAFRTLVASSVLVAAVGLDPHVLDPGMPSISAALKAEPDLQTLFLLAAVVQSGFVLVGGFAADTFRSLRLVKIALFGLIAASVAAIVAPDGAPLIVVRFLAWACDGLILPFAIGAVAAAYRHQARATALGIVYAVFGATTAAAPVLAMVLGAAGPHWPAYVACGAMSLFALKFVRRFARTDRVHLADRRASGPVALFAFGVVALVAGLIVVGDALEPLRFAMVAAGAAAVAAALWMRTRSWSDGAPAVDLRPVATALAAGVVIGFAQAAPLLQLPVFFHLVQGASPLLAGIAIAPFVVAIIVAGPVSGFMLARFSPRTLIAGGVLAVALADLLFWLVLGETTPYVAFVLPFLFIGAGFVIATTVRTAVIFASMPSALPASAAAFNEASLGLGSRLGVVVATVVMSQTALDAYRDSLVNLPVPTVDSLVAPFRDLITVIGLPELNEIVTGVNDATMAAYHSALIAGWRMGELIPGIVALVAAAVVFVAMGRHDPVRSVWDLSDEREA
jgi:DHA2 family multidrug resistance protein-like MFS transporter